MAKLSLFHRMAEMVDAAVCQIAGEEASCGFESHSEINLWEDSRSWFPVFSNVPLIVLFKMIYKLISYGLYSRLCWPLASTMASILGDTRQVILL